MLTAIAPVAEPDALVAVRATNARVRAWEFRFDTTCAHAIFFKHSCEPFTCKRFLILDNMFRKYVGLDINS